MNLESNISKEKGYNSCIGETFLKFVSFLSSYLILYSLNVSIKTYFVNVKFFSKCLFLNIKKKLTSVMNLKIK